MRLSNRIQNNRQRSIILLLIMLSLNGCSIHWTSTPVATTPVVDMEKGPQIVMITNDTPYRAQLTAALQEQGFAVVAPRTDESPQHLNAQWGIRFENEFNHYACFFNHDKLEFDFTLTLFDRYTQRDVLVLKQRGADQPCSSVLPVYNSMAKALRTSWSSTNQPSHPCYESTTLMTRREQLQQNYQHLLFQCER